MSVYKKYKDKDVRDAITVGLKSLTGLARVRLKSRWKKMNLKERCAAARSLVFMEQVVKNPDVYFSPNTTAIEWQKRVSNYLQIQNIKDVHSAYCLVPGPADVVYHNAVSALGCGVGRSYYNFCRCIQRWMYKNQTEKYAARIVDKSHKYKNMLEYESAKCFMRPFVEIKQSFQR